MTLIQYETREQADLCQNYLRRNGIRANAVTPRPHEHFVEVPFRDREGLKLLLPPALRLGAIFSGGEAS